MKKLILSIALFVLVSKVFSQSFDELVDFKHPAIVEDWYAGYPAGPYYITE